MKVINIEDFKTRKLLKEAIKQGVLCLEKRHLVSVLEIERLANDLEEKKRFEDYIKKQMAFEIAQFLINNEIAIFNKRPDPIIDVVELRLAVPVFVSAEAVERVKSNFDEDK